jgi:hypothetical protein
MSRLRLQGGRDVMEMKAFETNDMACALLSKSAWACCSALLPCEPLYCTYSCVGTVTNICAP